MVTKTETGDLIVLSPIGKVDPSTWSYAERLATLAGKRLGLVENGKYNSDRFLRELAEILNDQFGLAGVEMWRKTSPARGVAPDQVAEMRTAGIDLVVAGIGD